MSAPSAARRPAEARPLLRRLLCCRPLPDPPPDMGGALSAPNDGSALGGCSGSHQAPATMAEVVRERRKKCAVGAYGSAGGAALGALRRRLAAAARTRARACARAARGAAPRRPQRDRSAHRDRGPDHARCLRAAVAPWRPAEAAALLAEYDALAALRDVGTQAELARPPASALGADLAQLYDDSICPDAELVFKGSYFPVHRSILSARCAYFRDLLSGYPSLGARVSLETGGAWNLSTRALDAALRALYSGDVTALPTSRAAADKHSHERCQYTNGSSQSGQECCTCPCRATQDLDIISVEADSLSGTGGRRNRSKGRQQNVGACCASLQPPPDASLVRRLAEEFGFRPEALHRDLRYLLDSGDYSDASLAFTAEPAPAPVEVSCGLPPGPPGTPPAPRAAPRIAAPAAAPPSDYGFRPKVELSCHRAVLAARSPFFRNIIARRSRRQRESGGVSNCGGPVWCPPSTVRIALDESVVPRRFARALLHAAYTDQVDLTLIGRVQGQTVPIPTVPSSRSNAAVVAQQTAQTLLEDAMELYEIGRFVEMDIVAQGCEDAIVEALTPASLPRVLKWSSLPHGSKWVYRQAMRYLREEFGAVFCWGPEEEAGGAWGGRLPRAALAAALRCPFLQASEAQALQALLRWGEAELARRMEDREPNVVMGTAHSVARRGIRRRDLSDSELRDVIAPLVKYLRLSHILPNDPVAPDILNQVLRRGLLSTPPAQLVASGGGPAGGGPAGGGPAGGGPAGGGPAGGGPAGGGPAPAGPPLPPLGSPAAWLATGPYAGPRLFMPYYEEVKALLEDQMIQESEILRVRRARYGSDIPDTLYMVDSRPRGPGKSGAGAAGGGSGGASAARADGRDDADDDNDNEGDRSAEGSQDKSGNAEEAVAPPSAAMLAMQRRETELLSAPAIARALALPLADTDEIRRQIRLRVVREHNYPDAVADVLACVGLPMNQLAPPSNEAPAQPTMRSQYHLENRPVLGNSPDTEKPAAIADGAFKRYQDRGSGVDLCLDAASLGRNIRSGSRLPAVVTEGNIYAGRCDAQPSCSSSRSPAASAGAGLSEAMPDVAMATGSVLQRHHPPATSQRRHHGSRTFAIEGNQNNAACAGHAAPPAHSLPRPLYLNGNQHLLQDAGLRTINYPTGSVNGRRSFWPGQEWPNASGGLQLDLGDGAPHAPAITTNSTQATTTGTLSNRSSYCSQSPAVAAVAGPSHAPNPAPAPQETNDAPTSLDRHRRRPSSQPHDHLNTQRSDRSHVPRPNSSACVLYTPVDYTRYLVGQPNPTNVKGYSTLQQHRQSNSYRSHTQPCSIDDETVGGLLAAPTLGYSTLAAPPPYSHRSASPSTLHPLNYPSHSNYAQQSQGHGFRRADSCNLSTLSLGSNSGAYYNRNYAEERVYNRDSIADSYPRVESPFVSIQHAETSRGASPAGPSRGSSPYAYREDWPTRKLSNSPGFGRPSSRGQVSAETRERGSFRERSAAFLNARSEVPPNAPFTESPRAEAGPSGFSNASQYGPDEVIGAANPRYM